MHILSFRSWLVFFAAEAVLAGVLLLVGAHAYLLILSGLLLLAALWVWDNRPEWIPSKARGWLGWVDALLGTSRLSGETLPGFFANLMITIHSGAVARRQYMFEFQTPEGSRAGLFLSSNDMFSFSVRDVKGESHSLDLPIGKKGIPLHERIFLTCQVGVGHNATYLQVLVNGIPAAHKELPFRIDLGSRNWAQGTIGASADKRDHGAFLISMTAAGHVTLTGKQTRAFYRLAEQYMKDVQQG